LLNFFFQAEDGIRYATVTGVQTCALPISMKSGRRKAARDHALARDMLLAAMSGREHPAASRWPNLAKAFTFVLRRHAGPWAGHRSEERRVGKEGRSRWSRE